MFVRSLATAVLVALATSPALASNPAEDVVSTYATGTTGAKDMVWDAAGNLYVTGQDGGTGSLYKVPPGGGAATSFATGFLDPWGLAISAAGDLYVADRGDASIANSGVIYKVTTGGVKTVFKSGIQSPMFLAFGPGGDLYFSDWGSHRVRKLTPAAVLSEYATVGLAGEDVGGMVFDSLWNLYVGSGGSIKLVIAGGGPIVTVASALGEVVGMDRGEDGTIYFARFGFKDVWRKTNLSTSRFITAGDCVNDNVTAYKRSDARLHNTGSARLHGAQLYVTDSGCNRVRVVDFGTPAGDDSWGRVKSIYRR